MQKIEINNVEYEVPECWDDITFERYCEIHYGLEDNPYGLDYINTKNDIKMLSRTIGIDEDILLDAPPTFHIQLQNNFKWMYVKESFLFQDCDNEIEIDGVRYYIPIFQEELSTRQLIDKDIVMQSPDSPTKFIELLSVALINENEGRYTGDSKQEKELFEKLKKINCQKAFRLIGFFLLKVKALNEVTNIYTHMAQEINQLAQHIPIS